MAKPFNTETALVPMLAGKFNATKQRFPVYVQPKYDGIRCLVIEGRPYTRTLKPIPNRFIRNWFEKHASLVGNFDGELLVGEPTATDVYRSTSSGVMSEGGNPNFTFWVFDLHMHSKTFEARYNYLDAQCRQFILTNESFAERIRLAPTRFVASYETLMKYEGELVAEGYEGAILRNPQGIYKYGRAGTTGQELIKLKRFADDEATIVGFEELLSNQNEATKDALGHTKRSSHQENKVPMNMLGALVVRNAKGQFNIGSGFDMAARVEIWENRDFYIGKTVTYKYFPQGGYDLPRHPIFKSIRPEGS